MRTSHPYAPLSIFWKLGSTLKSKGVTSTSAASLYQSVKMLIYVYSNRKYRWNIEAVQYAHPLGYLLLLNKLFYFLCRPSQTLPWSAPSTKAPAFLGQTCCTATHERENLPTSLWRMLLSCWILCRMIWSLRAEIYPFLQPIFHHAT